MLSTRILLFILTLSAILFYIQYAHADTFSQASILLNRSAPSNPATALVCITTPSSDNGVENNVRVTFPDSFTVSSNTSNWTVSTSNIPNDSTAWPGIGTATNVSGQTVTFPSSNLNSNTKYCFRTANSASLTTSSSSGSHKGNISTYQTNSVIDTSGFGLNVNADQVSIGGTVPANATDFEAEIAFTSPSGDTFPQDTTLNYTITYGSNLASSSNIEVQAEWSLGTIENSGSPTVEILDYVIGSASNGYNSAPPVIDTINRTITWTINSFPANQTGETVTFQLKTNDSYTGSELISFDVSARVSGFSTQTPDSTVTKNYQYSQTITPTPTPQPTSASSSPSANTPTPTTTPKSLTAAPLNIDDIGIRQVSPNSAQVFVSLNKNANVAINYGTSSTNLSLQAIFSESSSFYLINLDRLVPNTQYYFRITASSESESLTSDVFTFRTSEKESEVVTLFRTFMVITNDTLIYSQSLADERKLLPLAIIPTETDFTFSIAFENSSQIKSIQAFLRNKFVLSAADGLLNVNLIKNASGEYTGVLNSGLNEGLYELYLRINDTAGNIFEDKVGEFRIANPLTILEKVTNKPIEGVLIKLYAYDESTRLYKELNSMNSSLSFPIKTNHDGRAVFSLPQGRYKAEFTSPLHKNTESEFVLGAEEDETYPIVYMERMSFSIPSIFSYLGNTTSDFYTKLANFIEESSKSNRFFELISFVVLSVFVIFSFVSLLFRTRHTPSTIIRYFNHIINRSKSDKPLRGVVKDENGEVVSDAQIAFLHKGEVVSQTKTNINGIFYAPSEEFSDVEILKPHYVAKTFPFNHQVDEKMPVFLISKEDGIAKVVSFSILETIKVVFGLLFELILVVLLLLEIAFIPSLGIVKVAPFLIITILMLTIFIHHNLLGKGRYF